MSPLQEDIDMMLIGETRHEDGNPWTYGEIVDWCLYRGLELSVASLSRHRSNHLMPSVQASIEVERQMEAISKATGKKLSIHSALMNSIVMKVLRLLDDTDLSRDDIALDKALRVAVQASRVAMNLQKTEHEFSKEAAQEVSKGLRSRGIPEDVINQIEEEVLGLRR
ncbi:phage protein Gp27 family protein [Deinococcus cellulosilyticus]|nr:phage protein Gp27 family protein [Deinococcus cellulosilyticus]